MGFYEQISKYYDYIFPVGEEQVEFLKSLLNTNPKRILDIACGSGGYSIELARSGHDVTAVDLDDEMVTLAKQKAKNENLKITILQGDMKELQNKFTGSKSFDFIFCIGNSIAHLGNPEDIQDALNQMYSIMDTGSTVVLQIINFDRIIKYNISELPTLENQEIGLTFERKYVYNSQNGYIGFNTVLKVCNSTLNERFENSIELFPILSNEFLMMLENANFKNIHFYGDFKFSPYNDKSFLLVIKAEKL